MMEVEGERERENGRFNDCLEQIEVFNVCFEVGLVGRFDMEVQDEEESEFRERRESFGQKREKESTRMRRERAPGRYISLW